MKFMSRPRFRVHNILAAAVVNRRELVIRILSTADHRRLSTLRGRGPQQQLPLPPPRPTGRHVSRGISKAKKRDARCPFLCCFFRLVSSFDRCSVSVRVRLPPPPPQPQPPIGRPAGRYPVPTLPRFHPRRPAAAARTTHHAPAGDACLRRLRVSNL